MCLVSVPNKKLQAWPTKDRPESNDERQYQQQPLYLGTIFEYQQSWHHLSWSSTLLTYIRVLMKSRVLMLGAGFVSRATLDILVEGGVEVTVGKLQIYELWYDHC